MEGQERLEALKFMESKGIEEETISTNEGFSFLSTLLIEYEESRDHEKYRVQSYDAGYIEGYHDGAVGKPMRKDLGKPVRPHKQTEQGVEH